MSVPYDIDPGRETRMYCPLYDVPGPGFYRFCCTLKSNRGEEFSDLMVAGFCPGKVSVRVTKEDDFDEFWQTAMRELKGIEPEYKVTLQSEKSTEKRNLYLVEMKSLGNIIVRGWLEAPKKSGRYPAILRVPGYTSAMEPVNKFDDMVIFSFNVRSHGNSDEVEGAPEELWVRGLDDKNDYYYRGTFMDCIRAMDFLASREEVDTERIAVWGGSQGGGLSFMTASLDERVNVCISDVPWLCSMKYYFQTTHWKEIDGWMAEDAGRNWKSMLRTMSYFDTMNMTDKITCPVLMRIGLQDKVCPPATSFASFNKIKSQKEYIVYPDKGHDLGKENWEFGYRWLRNYFGMK
jgi:cephalosporin-C deacetylase-like acetyl esterase